MTARIENPDNTAFDDPAFSEEIIGRCKDCEEDLLMWSTGSMYFCPCCGSADIFVDTMKIIRDGKEEEVKNVPLYDIDRDAPATEVVSPADLGVLQE